MLRRRLDREGGRFSDVGFFADDFGVVFDVDFPYVLTTVDLGVALGVPFGSFREFPLDGLISDFLGVAVVSVMDFLVRRFGPGGKRSSGRVLMRPDLRRPFSRNVVGPSADIFFHGGDSGFTFRALVGGVESLVLCLLDGRSSLPMSPFEPSWAVVVGVVSLALVSLDVE